MTTFKKMCSIVCAGTITIIGVTLPLTAAACYLFDTGVLPNVDTASYAVLVSIVAVSGYWCRVFNGLITGILSFLTPAKNVMEA